MIIAQTTMSGKKLFGGKGSLVDIAGHYAKIGYTGVDLSFHESADKSDKIIHWSELIGGCGQQFQRKNWKKEIFYLCRHTVRFLMLLVRIFLI